MKVLLLNPPAPKGFIRSGRWARKSRANQSWYPIHLAYCTGLLEQYGHECLLLDANTENFSEARTFLYTIHYKPDVIIYQWCYDNIDEDLALADTLTHLAPVILVGPWSLCAPNALQKTKNIHVMTYGEYEHTVLELLASNKLFTENLDDVKGIIWKCSDGHLIKNEARPLCSSEELDGLPFVSSIYKKHLDIGSYRQTSLKFPFVDLFTARSCPHACSYCTWIRGYQHLAPNRYRIRSIKNVIDELWFIRNELPQVKQVFFQDDTLTPKRAKELSEAILDENLGLCWGGYSRAEQSFEILRLMKESGCRTLHVGYESPIQSDLDLINKGISVGQMKEFASNVKKLDLWTSATFMVFPWQTKQEIKFVIDWCKRIAPKRMNLIQAQAYPNTPYAETLRKMGELQCLMGFEEMKRLEQWGFKQFYVYNPHFWWEVLNSPCEWKNVAKDAIGLLGFLNS